VLDLDYLKERAANVELLIAQIRVAMHFDAQRIDADPEALLHDARRLATVADNFADAVAIELEIAGAVTRS
jgi:hypothetical protein